MTEIIDDSEKKLDQFYTSDLVVTNIININIPSNKFFVDPCVGNGAFLPVFKGKNCLLIDIDPKIDGAIKHDFLTIDMSKYNLPPKDKVIVITNPPFGFAASLAVKFFNKCTIFSDEIRFIVPKTFRKNSIKNRLNLNYHLINDITLPKNSFVFKGELYDVPCCFQTWIYSTEKRKKIVKLLSDYFIFTTKEKANLAIRRVGGRAGRILNGLDYSVTSTYFLSMPDIYIEKLKNLEPSIMKDNTVGPRSISKTELIESIEEIINEI